MPTGLGNEKLWISATNDNTGTSTAFNDQSGNGNNGTANGGLAVVADSSAGGSYCFEFDGVDDYIDVVSSGVPAAAYSVSLWQYSTKSQISILFNAGDSNGKRNVNSDAIRSGTFGDAHGHTTSLGNTWVQNPNNRSGSTWYHHVLTYDGSTLRLYVNGVLVNSRTSVPNTNVTETMCYIGKYIGGAYEFRGRADDIRTYGRALTQAEINHLAAARGIQGPASTATGIGDEQLWLSATNSNNITPFNDLSGNSNNGTANGNMLVVADSSEGGSYAFDFDGTDDCISTGQDLLDGRQSFSVSAWFKSDTASNEDVIVSEYTNSSDRTFLLDLRNSGNVLGYTLTTGTDSTAQTSSSPIAIGSWYHVAYTFDSGSASVFVNGTLVASDTGAGTTSATSASDFVIGARDTGASNRSFFDGRQDDIRVFDRVLTTAEITHLASSRGVEGPAPVGLGDEQLWLCPSINDSADDISGNGNNGTYVGGMATVADTGSGGSLCYNHDTASKGITCPADLGISGDTMSISMWVNNTISSTGGSVDNWFSAYNSVNADSNMLIYQFGTNFRVADKNQTPDTTIVAEWPTTTTGTWRHIVAVADGAAGEYRVYENGTLVDTESAGGSDMTIKTTLPWTLGKTSLYDSARGKSDDIRVYDRSLTRAEIAHLASSRGVEGSPSTATQYNAFITHAFKQLFQTRLR